MPNEAVKQHIDLRQHIIAIALGYLFALMISEVMTSFVDPQLGLILYGILLIGIFIHSSYAWKQPYHILPLVLALLPLIRLIGLSLPLGGLPLIYWYLIISFPLFLAVWLTRRTLNISWNEMGVNRNNPRLQVLIGLTGLAFGYVQYYILRSESPIQFTTWPQFGISCLILLLSAGLLEELVFRGVIQKAITELLGYSWGYIFPAALYALFNLGYQSGLNIVFVFFVSIYYSWTRAKTGSIAGVVLSHGLTNIMALLVMPFMPPMGGLLVLGFGIGLAFLLMAFLLMVSVVARINSKIPQEI